MLIILSYLPLLLRLSKYCLTLSLIWRALNRCCHIVFLHISRKIVPKVKIYNKNLNTVSECKYLRVVLPNDLSRTKYVVRAKVKSFKQFYSFIISLYCVDHKVLTHIFEGHNISIAYHKTMKRMGNNRPYDCNHEWLERVNRTVVNHLIAKKVLNFAFSLFQSNSPCLSNHKC